MSESPEEIQRQIAALQAKLAAAQQTPHPTHGTVTATGSAEVKQAVGVNNGVIQAFFGMQPPVDSKELLDSYLDSLIQQYSRLRLGKLLPKDQSGREETTAPALSLRNVYTSLTTEYWMPVKDGAFAETSSKALRKHLQDHNPSQVMPEQVRVPMLREQGERYPPITRDLSYEHISNTVKSTRATLSGHWYQPELVIKAISRFPRVVLLGAPGSGKSTVLRYMTVRLAETLLTGEKENLPIPLFCQLGQVVKQFDDNLANDFPLLLDALFAPVERAGLRPELRPHIRTAWQRGGVLLFLDGLDEVSSVPMEHSDGIWSHRERMADAIRTLAENLGKSRIVVTCRIKPYEQDAAWQLRDPWQVRTIQPFTVGQVRRFIPAWYYQTTLTDQAKFTATEAEERSERLIDVLEQREDLHDLIGSPLLLTMLVLLDYNNKEMPTKRVDVYEALVDLLLDRWAEVRSSEKPQQVVAIGDRLELPRLSITDLRPVIYDIAFVAHQQAIDGRGVLDGTAVHAKLDSFFDHQLDHSSTGPRRRAEVTRRSAEFLHLLSEETGLIQDEGDGQYVLPHLTFEEYLAACHLEYRDDVQPIYQQWQTAPDRWREVILLLMGRLLRHNKFNMILSWLRLLLEKRCGKVDKSPVQHQRDAYMAALCYQEIGQRTYLEDRVDVLDLEQRMVAALVALLQDREQPLPVAQRVEAGFLLSDLEVGDPRFPVTPQEWQREWERAQAGDTSGYWCRVKGGTYRISGWKKGEAYADIPLPTFWIARYPVTVAQYAAFIAAGGYDNKKYWTSNGWKWKQKEKREQPWRWGNADYRGSNQAVIGVTWYEATAYAQWLHTQLDSVLPARAQVRLPTEAEWEAAAAYDRPGKHHRIYPWGDTPAATPELAIEKESGLGKPAPVGCCPAGAAACGAVDMVGNVWEVTSSSYRRYPAQSGKVINDADSSERDTVWRGGSYWSELDIIRCAVRYWDYPDLDEGIRVVLLP
jgi:formylglycine-generating enzyme required for sulfatase activity